MSEAADEAINGETPGGRLEDVLGAGDVSADAAEKMTDVQQCLRAHTTLQRVYVRRAAHWFPSAVVACISGCLLFSTAVIAESTEGYSTTVRVLSEPSDVLTNVAKGAVVCVSGYVGSTDSKAMSELLKDKLFRSYYTRDSTRDNINFIAVVGYKFVSMTIFDGVEFVHSDSIDRDCYLRSELVVAIEGKRVKVDVYTSGDAK